MIATVAGASVEHRRQLGACMGAPGPHDFAVRKCAARPSATHVHRIPLHVRDDRDTPLAGAERTHLSTISENTKQKNFCGKDWTAQISLKVQAKIDFARDVLQSISVEQQRARRPASLPGLVEGACQALKLDRRCASAEAQSTPDRA
ncbi:hypothetical protein [Bradyrhizobium sp. STM 3562]|uniref:hypothetical protein n=1 Tax=Bradyrhizobium sp. STM 3562 TaxID=578924 RepID=UPI00388E08E4